MFANITPDDIEEIFGNGISRGKKKQLKITVQKVRDYLNMDSNLAAAVSSESTQSEEHHVQDTIEDDYFQDAIDNGNTELKKEPLIEKVPRSGALF